MMTNESVYKGLIEAIQVATVEHGATIAFQPGGLGYGFDVLLLGHHCHVYGGDLRHASLNVTNFINTTLEEVDG